MIVVPTNMTPPKVLINNLVTKNVKQNINYNIDLLSQLFIYYQTVFGSLRFIIMPNMKLFISILLGLISSLSNLLLLYSCIITSDNFVIRSLIIFDQAFCTLLSWTSAKHLRNYYTEIYKFDDEIGYTPKATRQSIHNFIQTNMLSGLHLVVLAPYYMSAYHSVPWKDLFISIAYTLELFYFGHLLSILIPRLKLVNYIIETSLSTNLGHTKSFLKDYKQLSVEKKICETPYCMKKTMELYQIIVEAYNSLIDAIKWQLLILMISSFITSLMYIYELSLNYIREKMDIVDLLTTNVVWFVTLILALFSPCTFADSVHRQVRKLRELLASKLYENKLDKTGRSVTRALLAFTETRDLSFRLLRMLDIDISLPFKFVGLFITYLIILLQFEKVINPST